MRRVAHCLTLASTLGCIAVQAQVCRLSVAGLNRNRIVTGPVHAECPPSLHTPPFGNWGVTSNFGPKIDGRQFQGWCHETQVCDNNGTCSTQCRDGWYEWNSCTDVRQWAPPNCSLYNDGDCTRQRSTTGINIHGSRTVDVSVRCPVDTDGDGVADQGGCADASTYRSGANFLSLYELDLGTTDDLIQTMYFPEVVLTLQCDQWGCTPTGSDWLEPAFYDSPATPAKVYAQFAAVVNSATFVDTSRACQAVGPVLRTVSGASFQPRVAPASFASVFGSALSVDTAASASPMLAPELAGTRVSITDANGGTLQAQLSYVSPGQVNLLIPSGIPVGTARMTVTRSDTVSSTGTFQVTDVAPALFSASATGRGVAAAIAVRVSASGVQSNVPVFSCVAPAECTAVPIDLGTGSDQVHLSLYGTGIRRRPEDVRVTIGGVSAPVSFAGQQPTYPGLDQVNVLVPAALRGRGIVQIVLVQAGMQANIVEIAVQ